MRLIPALTLPVACLIPLAGCSAHWDPADDGKPGITASGSGGERRYAADSFDTVALGTAADVAVHVGGGYSVVATGTSATLDTLKVVRDGHSLRITQAPGFHWRRGNAVHVVITMPRIAGADIGGSGSIMIDRAEGAAFVGDVGGSGSLDVRGLRVGEASFAVGGSGSVKAAGATDKLSASISGSGAMDARPLGAGTADVSVAGSGGLYATVRHSASVSMVGSGTVTITGGAKCSITKMGSGEVHCG